MLGNTALELLNMPSNYFVSNEELMLQKLGVNRVLNSHEKIVNTLCWSYNGRYLLSGAEDSIVKVWSVNGSLMHTQKTSTVGMFETLKFVPYSEAKVFVYTDTVNNLFIQDIEREEPLLRPSLEPVQAMSVTESQPFCIYCLCNESKLSIYDVRRDGAVTLPFEMDNLSLSFDICRDQSESIAFGAKDGSINVFDFRYARRPVIKFSSADHAYMVMQNSLRSIRNLHFNEKGTEIIVTDYFGTGYLFDVNEGTFKLRENLSNLKEKACLPVEPVRLEVNSSNFERTVGIMQDLMVKKRLSKAFEISSEALCHMHITDPLQVSIIRHMRTFCLTKRGWIGDKYMCLREIIKAYEMNPSSCHILYDLIKHLALMGQYHLALSFVDLYKTKFAHHAAPSIDVLESQIMYDDKKSHPEYFHVMSDSDFIDYKERYIGCNNAYTSFNDVNYFGSHQQYIVASTYNGSFLVYQKNGALLRNAMLMQEDKIRLALPNPVQPIIATGHSSGSIRFWEPTSSNEQDIHRIDDNFNVGRFFTPRVVGINDYSEIDGDDVNVEGQCRVT